MDGDLLLTTTRSVRRRLDFDAPVDRDTLLDCLRLAVQAPTGGNLQGWRFLVVSDPEKRRILGELYKRSFYEYAAQQGQGQAPRPSLQDPEDPRARRFLKVVNSSVYLADHMHRAPVHVIPCLQGRPEGMDASMQAGFWGSILPAAWSFMLALRSRGLGTAWTTLHLRYEKEAAAALGVPDDFTQAALLPVARYTGEGFRPAHRVPVEDVTYWDEWGRRDAMNEQ